MASKNRIPQNRNKKASFRDTVVIVGWYLLIAFFLMGVVALFNKVCGDALISFKKMTLISAIPSLFTIIFIWNDDVKSFAKQWLISLFAIVLIFSFWSFAFLSINYIPVSSEVKTERYEVLRFSERYTKRGRVSGVYAHIKKGEDAIKVKLPNKSSNALKQYDKIQLKTRKGLFGIEIILEKELMKTSPEW